jgi:hypothetical protein
MAGRVNASFPPFILFNLSIYYIISFLYNISNISICQINFLLFSGNFRVKWIIRGDEGKEYLYNVFVESWESIKPMN